MKTVDQHLADCLAAVDVLSPLELRLLDAHGCTLSEDVTATWDLPEQDLSMKWVIPPEHRSGLVVRWLASASLAPS